MAAPIITRTPWIDDDGTNTIGTVLNNAVKTELYNQIDAVIAQFVATTGGTTMAGDLLFVDNLYDIGKSGATRPRDGFFARNLVVSGVFTVSNNAANSMSLTGSSTNSIGFTINNTVASGHNWSLGSSGSGPSPVGTFVIYDSTAGAPRVILDTLGNVGIGLTPTALAGTRRFLHIQGPVGLTAALTQFSDNAADTGRDRLWPPAAGSAEAVCQYLRVEDGSSAIRERRPVLHHEPGAASE